MEKKRKDSISGQMRFIERLRDWRKKSLVGLGFYGKGSKQGKKGWRGRSRSLPVHDDMDDIEIIEQLVHEQVDFDWEKFEVHREQSLFMKNMKEGMKGKTSVVSVNSGRMRAGSLGNVNVKKFQEVKLPDPPKLNLPNVAKEEAKEEAKVEAKDEDSGEVEGVEGDSDEESLPSIIEKPYNEDSEEDYIGKISGEGKEKLKFVMEFAKKKNQRKQRGNFASDLEDPLALTKSMMQSRASRKTRLNIGSRQNRRGSRKPSKKPSLGYFSDTMSVGSMNSRTSRHSQGFSNPIMNLGGSRDDLERLYRERLRLMRTTQTDAKQLQALERSRELEDQFARYKGFKSAKHMQRHFERLRGFEELRNETQIDLMARENGYKPNRNSRIQSVLSYLDTSEDFYTNIDSEKDMSPKTKQNGRNESGQEETDDDVAESDFESGGDNDSDVCKFMDYEGDDLVELAEQWDKVQGFNDDLLKESDDDIESVISDASDNGPQDRAKRKENRRKRAIRRGWARTRKEHENDFVQRRNRPFDSLTLKHLNDVKLS